jgi:hypothetical protein
MARFLRPADVGLPAGGRRRTPGLRREEVARLAHMSVGYYTRLAGRAGPYVEATYGPADQAEGVRK